MDENGVPETSNTAPAQTGQLLIEKANLELRPGSESARAKGCSCPYFDNAKGIGYMGVWGNWVVIEGCPLHMPAKPELKKDGAGWTLVKYGKQWCLERSEFWHENGYINDCDYEDAPEMPDMDHCSENTYKGEPDLDQYRARGFEVLEDPIWWYDKRFKSRKA